MNHSTCSHLDVIPLMTTPEAGLWASQDLLFKTARNDAYEDVLISAWKALDDEIKHFSAEAAAAANGEAPVENESRQIQNRCTNKEGMIVQEVKSAGKELVMAELATKVEESLDGILRILFLNAKSGI